jgi:hypothetical protein
MLKSYDLVSYSYIKNKIKQSFVLNVSSDSIFYHSLTIRCQYLSHNDAYLKTIKGFKRIIKEARLNKNRSLKKRLHR